ncbi:MAG TPA: chromosomal replication initiator DnaA [Acetobacteraceae bacterium]|jgi:chromosomal replication initiation ATPase DnaA
MTATNQYPLPFIHRPTHAAADFIAAPSNDAARAWLDRTTEWPDHRLALWGDPGVGKTHLLHLWAARHNALWLAGPALHDPPDISAAPAITLDDADAVPADTALLHLLNTARDLRLPILLAARTPPARWSVRLPDLASRLRAITAVPIDPPEDSLLHALLTRLLADRQIGTDQAVLDWLLLRLPRSAAALREAADRLDRASLAAGGKINRKIAVSVVADMGGATQNPSPADPSLL